jgi:hypothetical protein
MMYSRLCGFDDSDRELLLLRLFALEKSVEFSPFPERRKAGLRTF